MNVLVVEDEPEMASMLIRGLQEELLDVQLAPCQEPSSMALDLLNRRLFLGCRNRVKAVVNADSGKVVGQLSDRRSRRCVRVRSRSQTCISFNRGR
jgi:hypothetical protein